MRFVSAAVTLVQVRVSDLFFFQLCNGDHSLLGSDTVMIMAAFLFFTLSLLLPHLFSRVEI